LQSHGRGGHCCSKDDRSQERTFHNRLAGQLKYPQSLRWAVQFPLPDTGTLYLPTAFVQPMYALRPYS
jgi:hypothetical protein